MVPWVFREAFKVMREGRPGPVLIDLPLDVQKGEIEYDPDTDVPLADLPHPARPKSRWKRRWTCCFRRSGLSCFWGAA